MYITNVPAPVGSNKKKKYLGRGVGSGHGKTSTRGHKGQGARAGRDFRPGFEGGSMTLLRRLPKRGFRSRSDIDYQIVNVEQLNHFSKGSTVTALSLKEEGLIKDENGLVKLLGDGKLNKALTIKVNKVSQSAKNKIAESGSTLELISVDK
ncbi:MAG: 50S ribosomal protein L15 [Candidatus Omnitrophica bacterium]|nr:50S ribosomal protein L15 [Candidatus Omnitrophota bacterium]MDD5352219.1 50S ribosomal protein L15 [Candidatus Omnitrophota bacterium]MDD5549817.1 50S ribosomal protein L15 [Candidatus Omnitrophota bacterium]